jgi:hypothetical protein
MLQMAPMRPMPLMLPMLSERPMPLMQRSLLLRSSQTRITQSRRTWPR